LSACKVVHNPVSPEYRQGIEHLARACFTGDFAGVSNDPFVPCIVLQSATGAWIGYVSFRVETHLDGWAPSSFLRVEQLGVAPQHRWSGVGNLLVQEIMRTAELQHVSAVKLWSLPSAVGFFQRLMFQRCQPSPHDCIKGTRCLRVQPNLI
jgi:GNAT superfamily N-acetyltransferase